ncbi:MAG: hypothetical protein M3114_06290 [Thermoproteota archaeon]|nr:hypothetical protein [Thermoproteota archaeon]
MVSDKAIKYMLGVTVHPELVKELDECGGEVPQSRVVEGALSQFLEREKGKRADQVKPIEKAASLIQLCYNSTT